MAQYAVAGWGIGELVFEDGQLVYHELPRPRSDRVAESSESLAQRLRAYFEGSRDRFADVELDLDGCSPFQRAVVEVVRSIPYGEVASYGEVAALAGHSGAHRAVGSVCAGNRFPIFVPCHRVVTASGLGSYGSLGLEYKRRLLRLEHVVL